VEDLDGLGPQAGQRLGHVGRGAVAERGQEEGVDEAAVLHRVDAPGEADREAAVAGLRRGVGAHLAPFAAAVLEGGEPPGRLAGDLEGEPGVGAEAHGQRQAHAAREPGRAAAGAQHDALVLGPLGAGHDLHGARARAAQRDDLVEADRVAQRAGQGVDGGSRADRPAALVEHRGAVVGGQEGEPVGELLGADAASRHVPDPLEDAQAALDRRADRHRAVPRDELGAEALAPLVPERARVAHEGGEARIVVRVAEDARLAAGLRLTGAAALVDGRHGAPLGEGVGRRQPDHAGAHDGDRGSGGHQPRLPGRRAVHARSPVAAGRRAVAHRCEAVRGGTARTRLPDRRPPAPPARERPGQAVRRRAPTLRRERTHATDVPPAPDGGTRLGGACALRTGIGAAGGGARTVHGSRAAAAGWGLLGARGSPGRAVRSSLGRRTTQLPSGQRVRRRTLERLTARDPRDRGAHGSPRAGSPGRPRTDARPTAV
jgi:hypothetical protein